MLLAGDVRLRFGCIASEFNPADRLSRRKRLEAYQRKRPVHGAGPPSLGKFETMIDSWQRMTRATGAGACVRQRSMLRCVHDSLRVVALYGFLEFTGICNLLPPTGPGRELLVFFLQSRRKL